MTAMNGHMISKLPSWCQLLLIVGGVASAVVVVAAFARRLGLL